MTFLFYANIDTQLIFIADTNSPIFEIMSEFQIGGQASPGTKTFQNDGTLQYFGL